MSVYFGQVKLAFDTPIKLAGYLRERTATTLSDPLYLSGLFINNVAILVIDGIGISHRLSSKIKETFPQYQFLVFATHTHSGVKGLLDTDNDMHVLNGQFQVFGHYDEMVEKTILDAIIKLMASKVKAGPVRYKEFTINSLWSNRNNQAKPFDNRVLIFESDVFILYHFACHPTILNDSFEMISSDFVGGLRHLSNKPVFFINGAAGDISTRFTRSESTIAECRRFATRLKREADKHQAKTIDLSNIAMSEHLFSLKLKKLPEISDLLVQIKHSQQLLESDPNNRQRRGLLEGQKLLLTLAQNPVKTTIYNCCYQLIQLDKLRFVSIPLEIFSELTLELDCYILGYGNDYALYLSNRDAFDQNYYEALSSPYQPGEGERFIKEIRRKLNEDHP